MSLSETIEFILSGAAVVGGTLSLLAILGVIWGHIFVRVEKRFGDVDDPVARKHARDTREREIIEEEEQRRIAAIIGAALSQVIHTPHRVIGFKNIGPNNWSAEGRAQLHAGRKVR